ADLFMLVDQNYMSQLKTVDVWHQRRGRKDAWLLHSIDVIDHQTNMLYHFPCGNWLGHSSDDTYYNMNFVSLDAVGQPVSAISRKDFAPQNHS
uniref:PLAT domain-containing protein n=2 Tax=Bursaphelenchus xylophilus TaxID=6326 RepID=A0A1I7SHS8_BURXY